MEYFVILKILVLVFHSVYSLSSSFFEDGIEYRYSCSVQFDYPRNFDCACLSGLWNLYSSDCNKITTIGGNDDEDCFQLSDPSGFTRAEQIVPDKYHISIQQSDGSIEVYEKGDHQNIKLHPKDTIIVGNEYSLEDAYGESVCLAMIDTASYCYFSVRDLDLSSITKISKACKSSSNYFLPSKCIKENAMKKNSCGHQINKRDTNSITNGSSNGSKQQGRVFFGGPGMNLTLFNSSISKEELANSTAIFDEDFINSTATNVTTPDDAIASEIWNFIDMKLDEILGLKEETEMDMNHVEQDSENHEGRSKRATSKKSKLKSKTLGSDPAKLSTTPVKNKTMKPSYRSPVYQFLDLAKQVMQKTCPSGYVNPDWFDLAISTFIRIQKKHFKFPEAATNYFGYWRIAESLKSCVANVTTFNFTTNNCTSRELPVSGTFCAYGNCTEEISIMAGFDDFDPLVETVWNVFKNAHAACFSYFNQNYNDHHRFTMWMLPLFQNQVNQIWKNGSAHGIAYGGVFGNQANVQTAIAYCSAASSLESKYPWELPRPNQIDELVNGTLTTGRRKRDVSESELTEGHDIDFSAQCILPKDPLKCKS